MAAENAVVTVHAGGAHDASMRPRRMAAENSRSWIYQRIQLRLQ